VAVANTLAYHDTESIVTVKSFIVQALGKEIGSVPFSLKYFSISSGLHYKTFYDQIFSVSE
jgi:hypothetical protein